MNIFSDILGLKLPKAEEILKSQGIKYKVIETASPRQQEITGEFRVIRQKMTDDTLVITVCRI